MTYYSPGTKFCCPSCKSNRIGFIFENDLRNISQKQKQIHQNQVVLSEPKINFRTQANWLCYDCYDCGTVEKRSLEN